MKPLVTIPAYLREQPDVGVLGTCIESIRKTVDRSVDILVVDDGSPYAEGFHELAEVYGKHDFEVHHKDENEGYSKTVNVGLRRALEEGRDAVTINADMQMLTPGWVRHCCKTTDPDGNHAAVVGALLLYPNGLIQHAGVYFSLLTRGLYHRYQYGPANLPEALEKAVLPVTGAFQYIRYETLERVGLYDEGFKMAFEDMDYCVRVFNAGLSCVYNPNVRAYHYESLFRGVKSKKLRQWEWESWMRFVEKYKDQSFGGLVPEIV